MWRVIKYSWQCLFQQRRLFYSHQYWREMGEVNLKDSSSFLEVVHHLLKLFIFMLLLVFQLLLVSIPFTFVLLVFHLLAFIPLVFHLLVFIPLLFLPLVMLLILVMGRQLCIISLFRNFFWTEEVQTQLWTISLMKGMIFWSSHQSIKWKMEQFLR